MSECPICAKTQAAMNIVVTEFVTMVVKELIPPETKKHTPPVAIVGMMLDSMAQVYSTVLAVHLKVMINDGASEEEVGEAAAEYAEAAMAAVTEALPVKVVTVKVDTPEGEAIDAVLKGSRRSFDPDKDTMQ